LIPLAKYLPVRAVWIRNSKFLAAVKKTDTVSLHYWPFNRVLEEDGSFDNPFMFTGQWFDDEISQYYLRARMYDPVLMRFTARDPRKRQIQRTNDTACLSVLLK